MPRLPINFANTMIYKLCCNDVSITDLYVGATTNFKQRKGQHKRRCCNPNDKSHHLKVYQFIRENGGWNNWNMILVEQYPCENQLESNKRERYWFEFLQGTLNSLIPGRTMKEWRQKNAVKKAEQKKEYDKAYKQDNAVKIAEQRKIYLEKNAVKIAEQKKEYYKHNAVKIAEQKKANRLKKKMLN